MEYTEILPQIYVGSVQAVQQLYNIHGNQLRVVNCANEINKYPYIYVENYYKLPLFDTATVEDMNILFTHIDDVIDFINLSKRPILIHCAMGISRSCTIMALYLYVNGWSINDAIKYIMSKRPIAFFNGSDVRYIKKIKFNQAY